MALLSTSLLALPTSGASAANFAPTQAPMTEDVSIQDVSRTQISVRVFSRGTTPPRTYFYNDGTYRGTLTLFRTIHAPEATYGHYRGTVSCTSNFCPI